jgi:drug/metabolite transporter (DMT)-like permease
VTAVLLALLASAAWGFADYAGGVASRTLRVPVVLAGSMLAGYAVLVPVLLAHGAPAFQAEDALWAAASGAVAVGSLGLMFRAMAVGQVSIVGPVTACGVAIPVVIGLARGEQPHAVQLAGMALAVLGVVLASIETRPDKNGRQLVAGLWLALGAAVCIGLWFVAFDRASTNDPYWAALVARTATASIAVAVAMALRRPAAPAAGRADALPPLGSAGITGVPALRGVPRPVLLLVVASGLADAVAEVSYAVSTTRGYMSLVAVVASLYPAFMVGLAAVWLRERPARHQLAGVAAALTGIALISAG